MNPGELDRRITLIQRTSSQQANNEIFYTYSDYNDFWAKYEPISETEIDSEEMLSTYERADFTIRYFRDSSNLIDTHWRVSYNNKLYNILGIEIEGRKDYIKLICESRSKTIFKT